MRAVYISKCFVCSPDVCSVLYSVISLVLCSLFGLLCAVYIVHCAVCSVQCALLHLNQLFCLVSLSEGGDLTLGPRGSGRQEHKEPPVNWASMQEVQWTKCSKAGKVYI